MRIAITACALLVFCGSLSSAQTVGSAQHPADPIAQQLDSTDARTVAWGAYNAGVYLREDLIPRLVQLLQVPPPADPIGERLLTAIVMDALIQLHARVPPIDLMPHVDRQPVQTLVLLSNATDREDVLLALLPRVSGLTWFGVADMLFADRSPGLAAHLVQTVRLRLTVHVTDADGGFGIAGGYGGSSGCSGIYAPGGYPPVAEYFFEASPRPGVLVLATGPHAVYYSRIVRRYSGGGSPSSFRGPTDQDRVDFLRAMALESGDSGLRAETQVSVRWSTAEGLLERVDQLRSEVAQSFRALIDRARTYYPVPEGLDLQGPIDVRLVDRRSHQDVPLPPVR